VSLPTPLLDNRRFQDIVDEAKRLIPRYCPEWTDHNLSDPGVAMIELFAWMTDMMIYRLNQVPDILYTRFLELMGIELYPAAPARVDLTFWLSAPQAEPVVVPAGTQVGTVRTDREESIVFMTNEDLTIAQPDFTACLTATPDGRFQNKWDDLRAPGQEVACFPTPAPGDAIYLGFESPLEGSTLELEIEAHIEGIGVDPLRPPWAWETWSGESWVPATVYRDGTSGLNASGSLILLLGRHHEPLTLGPIRAYWLRCRMVEPEPDQPPYRESPQVGAVTPVVLGGSALAHHARPVPEQMIGLSDGTPGQVMRVKQFPVLPRRAGETIKVSSADGDQDWIEVPDFAASEEDSPHFTWNDNTGEIAFGPRIEYPDGTARHHGAIPPIDARVFARPHRVGGGTRGNVGAGTLTVLKSSIPFVARVENLQPARGGVDPETIDNAKLRGPTSLRTGQRAVTARDFEQLTLEASSEVARARCLPPSQEGGPVRLLLVPRLHVSADALVLDDLSLGDELLERVTSYLDERRIVGTRVEISTPFYQGITVVTRIRSAPGAQTELVRDRAINLLYEYVNPLTGGPEGLGWPFGRDLNVGELFALLSGVEGVTGIEEVLIFLADLRTGRRGEPRQRVAFPDDALPAAYQHQVLVR
jgi:predicted phage baseplate assembly protein